MSEINKSQPESSNENLDQIEFSQLPLNWDALNDLLSIVNSFLEYPVSKDVLINNLPSELNIVLPMISSVVANNKKSEVDIKLPNYEEVRRLKMGLPMIAWTLGHLPAKWLENFNNYCENRAEEIILNSGQNIIDMLNIIEKIENPQDQLITELTLIYKKLQQKQYDIDHYLNIREKTHSVLKKIYLARTSGIDKVNHWKDADDFPIFFKLFSYLKTKHNQDTLDGIYATSMAGPEMAKSLKAFLESHGVDNLKPLSKNGYLGLRREIAELFAGDKLRKVTKSTSQILENFHDFLPSNGPEFTASIYEIMAEIAKLDPPVDSHEIINKIFMPEN